MKRLRRWLARRLLRRPAMQPPDQQPPEGVLSLTEWRADQEVLRLRERAEAYASWLRRTRR